MFSRWMRHAGALIVGLSALSPAVAQDEPIPPTDHRAAEVGEGAAEPAATQPANRYRIGLGCTDVHPAVRAQLGLAERQGLLVEQVMPGSPAEKAGIKQYDVVLRTNGRELRDLTELVQAVNESAGKELALTIIRRGAEQSVQVTPEPRPADEVAWLEQLGDREPWQQFPGLPPEAREQFEQWGRLPGIPGFGMRQFRPGIILDENDWPTLPENFSLQMEKKDDGPAKIHVQRGNEKWDVTEDNLKDLPEDLRPLVENMLHGTSGGALGLTIPRGPGGRTARPLLPRIERDDQLDEVNEQLRALRDAIERLKNSNK